MTMNLAISPGSTLMERDRVASLCSSWLLRQRSSSLLVAPGTTFPPLKQHLPYFKEQLERFATAQQEGSGADSSRHCKCLSEPDLSHDMEDEDDYLFEFDIGSPADSQKEDLGSEEEQIKVVNVVEDYEEAMQQFPRRFSISSDTCSNCSSKETYREEFRENWITSSRIGGRRRSSQEMKDTEERLEGLSVEPEMWKQNCALYLGIRGDGSGGSGTATPILSPKMDSSLSPLVSPDSVLEDDMEPSMDYCSECSHQEVEGNQASDQERLLKQERLSPEKDGFRIEKDERNSKDTNISEQEKTSREKELIEDGGNISEKFSSENISVSEDTSEDISVPEVRVKFMVGEDEEGKKSSSNTVEINPNLVVSSDKLASLLCHLEEDKHYPSETPSPASKETSPSRGEGVRFLTLPPRPDEGDLDGEDDIRPKLRKCSSLRSGRTPPVTPGSRKIVRFADIFGLDLSVVKVFSDEIPRVPKTAYKDLDVDPAEYTWPSSPTPRTRKTHHLTQKPTTLPSTSLVPMFNQPGSSPHFFEKVQGENVVLESAFMDGVDIVSGVVRVLNLSFHKSVTVRWTVNDWSTVSEQAAEYMAGSSSGGMDKFSFRLAAQSTLAVGTRLQFCVKFVSSGEEFWDSNGGSNYLFQVFPNNSSSKKSSSGPLDISSRGGLIPSRTFFASQSPSHHGDDPWLRYM